MPKPILGSDPFDPEKKPARTPKAKARQAPVKTKAKATTKSRAKPAPPKKSTRPAKAGARPVAASSSAKTEAAPPAAPVTPSRSQPAAQSPDSVITEEPAKITEPAPEPAVARAEPVGRPDVPFERSERRAGGGRPDVPFERSERRAGGGLPSPADSRSEYGPSLDRPGDSGRRDSGLGGRVVEIVRHFEEGIRTRLGQPGGGESRPHAPPLEFLWRRWSQLAMRDRSDVVDEFGRDPRVADEFASVLEFFYRTWFRVESHGLEHLPASGRTLIVGNHSGTLPYDAAMIMYGVRHEHPAHREVRPLVEDFVFHFPYLGTLMNRIGGVRACQENAERLLRNDQLVAVFPEGIKGIGKLFSQRYQLQRFGRGGFIKLALATDSPIIPVAVIGAEEIHPMLAKVTWLSKGLGLPYLPITPTFPWFGPLGLLPLPTRWSIAYGEPLYFNAEYGADAAYDRILVGKLAEQVRQRIQEMIDSLLRERKSVLFG